MGPRPLYIFITLTVLGSTLIESDVYRRQILMTKVDPRAVRVKTFKESLHVGIQCHIDRAYNCPGNAHTRRCLNVDLTLYSVLKIFYLNVRAFEVVSH